MSSEFKLPMTFKKYCKNNLLFLGKRFDWNKIYNQCLIHYGKEILEQSIKELVQEGKITEKKIERISRYFCWAPAYNFAPHLVWPLTV